MRVKFVNGDLHDELVDKTYEEAKMLIKQAITESGAIMLNGIVINPRNVLWVSITL